MMIRNPLAEFSRHFVENQERQREAHNDLVREVRGLAHAIGVLQQRSEIDIHKSIIKDLYGQSTMQARAIMGVGYVALFATWRVLRPELGDTLFRWVGLLSIVSLTAFIAHEVTKIVISQLHLRRVTRAMDDAGVEITPTAFRTLLKQVDNRLFRIWAVMMWVMVPPAALAAGIMLYSLAAAL